MSTLKQRVALVTGAGRNIGRATALALARDGLAVVVNVRSSAAEGQAVVDEIRALGQPAMLCLADVTDQAAVQRMLAEVQAQWGRLDVLVNNAAIRKEGALATLTASDWHGTLAVVLDGAFLCAQAALPLLTASDSAAIINVGGLTAHTGAAQRVHVVTAKAGLVGLTRALAVELAPQGITVNCVSPGLIDSVRHAATRQTLLGRRGTVEAVADAIAWLASLQARFMTGQVTHVNGGAYLGG